MKVALPDRSRVDLRSLFSLFQVNFMTNAVKVAVVWEQEVKLPAAAVEATHWLCNHTRGQAVRHRRRTLYQIRQLDETLRKSSEVKQWWQSADRKVLDLAGHINGPLLLEPAQISGHKDLSCIDFFRHGAPLVGLLDYCGAGEPKTFQAHASIEDLYDERHNRNNELLKSRPHTPFSLCPTCFHFRFCVLQA